MAPESHVIVCGFGRVGQRVVELLDRLGTGVMVVSLEPHARVQVGDARQESVLRAAGIERSRAVIVVTGDDATNVSIALEARRLAPTARIVIRLFDQDLGAHLEAAIGIRHAVSTSALAAPAFLSAALGRSVLLAFEVDGARWVLDQTGGDWTVRAAPRAERHGHLLMRGLGDFWIETPRLLRLSLLGLIAIVVVSVVVFHAALGLSLIDAYYFVITTISTTGYGDFNLQNAPAAVKIYGTLVMLAGAALIATLYSLVTDLLLRTRLRDVVLRGAAHQAGHVVVAGLGSIGWRVIRELVACGEHVVAIEKAEGGPFLDEAREIVPVVIGDAKAEETLRKAGVARARVVVAATDADLVNLSTALAARRIAPDCRVVVRLFDAELAARLRGSLDLDAILSVSGAAAPTLVGSALHEGVLRGVVRHDALVLLVRTVVGPAHRAEGDERLLLVRHPGQRGFEVAAVGVTPAASDEAIVVRQYRLQ